MPESGADGSSVAGEACFATTHWSVVLSVRSASAPEQQRALEALCRAYWYPLYAHVRRRGHDPESARDLTQTFFAELLSRQGMDRADPNRGRFRSFLLASLDNVLRHAHREAQALKRGGGREIVSIDAVDAEARLAMEPAGGQCPDREFDRRWALATLERARQRMREEFSLAGKEELFERLRPHLLGESAGDCYAQIAAELNMTVVAVKVTVHRLRRRYGAILREEVAQTLADPGAVDEELRHLIEALGDGG